MSETRRRVFELSLEQRKALEERLLSRHHVAVTATKTLSRRTRSGPASLSSAQLRLLFLSRLDPDSVAYNIPLVLRLKGPLQVPALEAALGDILARHDVLRATIPENGQPRMCIGEASAITVTAVDTKPSTIEQLAIDECRRPFDLVAGPLVRFHLLRLSSEEHWLVTTMHHIVTDDWSFGVFQRDLAAAYAARTTDTTPGWPELAVQYPDFAEWQRESLDDDALARELDYWKQLLRDAPGHVDLPTDRPRPAAPTFSGAKHDVLLPRALGRALRDLGNRHRATLFMVLLAAISVVLHRKSGRRHIFIGSPIAGRTRTELENLIGLFVNMLVLRSDLSHDPRFAELLGRVRTMTLEAFAHQSVPFEELVHALRRDGDPLHSSLFQVALAVQNAPPPPTIACGLELERVLIDIGAARFDATLFVYEKDQGLMISIEYSTELFDHATVARTATELRAVLEAIVRDPTQRVSTLSLAVEL